MICWSDTVHAHTTIVQPATAASAVIDISGAMLSFAVPNCGLAWRTVV